MPLKLTEEQKEKILSMYEISDGNVTRAGRTIGEHSANTITNVWRNNNLKIRSRGRLKGCILNQPFFREYKDFIEQGLSMKEICDMKGVTRQAVHAYFKRSDLNNYFKSIQIQNKKKRANLLETLANQVQNIAYKQAKINGFATTCVLDYIHSLKHFNRINSFEHLLNFFENYEKALINNERPSLMELANKSGLKHASSAKDRIQFAGLTSFNSSRKRLSEEKINSLKRAYELEYLNIPDIAYFADIYSGTIYPLFDRLNKKHEFKKKARSFTLIKKLSKNSRARRVSYSKAHTIYEAYDAGFDLEGISEYSGANKNVIDFVLSKREDIEIKIKKAIDILKISS
ncbi:MAG: hypothetical protein KKA64_00005 [Nanoarchaeota archaeon]|nr:hypothetical protein [Nanoarchaeota archaeon]